MEHSGIACEWVAIKSSPYSTSDKTKVGRYHGSCFRFSGYGVKKWAVCGYLKLKEQTDEELSKQEIIDGCLEYLNRSPKKKKYSKKDPRPKYGLLEPVYNTFGEYDVVFMKDKIMVIFATDERKNKNFWGEGSSMFNSSGTIKRIKKKK